MTQQMILAVDDNGKFLEYIPKEVGHTGKGRRHLAITVLLVNQKGEVLLQKRKHKVFDNIWDFTGSTHPLHKEDKDESLEDATRRCLKEEWGIREIREIREIGVFNYFAPYHTVQGDFCENETEPLFCENEHCFLMVGQYDGAIKMSSKVGYKYKWVDKKEFLKDVEVNPQKYAPWVIEGCKLLNF